MDAIINILQQLTTHWQTIGAALGGITAVLLAVKAIISIFKPKVK